jgi:hypothetical protein
VFFTAPKAKATQTGWQISPTLGGLLVRSTF